MSASTLSALARAALISAGLAETEPAVMEARARAAANVPSRLATRRLIGS